MSSITAHVLGRAMAMPDEPDTEPDTGLAAVHAEAAQLLTGLADATRDRAAFLATINTGSSDQAATLNAQVAARIQKLADGETAHAAVGGA